MSFSTNNIESKVKYSAIYITPMLQQGDDYLCDIETVIGKNIGKKYDRMHPYPKTLFEKYFHGTLIMFCKNNKHITDIQEIKDNFDVSFHHAIAYNSTNNTFYASDGVIYDMNNNYYCNHNPQTKINILNSINACNSFYVQLIKENKSGKILDITLITNPDKNIPFVYKHRIERGFVPADMLNLRDIKKDYANTRSKNPDEKLSQEDIDKLIADLYVNI